MKANSSSQHRAEVLVLMRESDIAKTGAFAEFARKFRPKYIYDMRVAPRLDFFAGTRLKAFRLFSELELEYFDIFGRAGISSRGNDDHLNHVLLDSINNLLDCSRLNDGPIVLFFDNEELFDECKKALPSFISCHSNIARHITVSQYKSGLLSMQQLF